MTNTIYLILVAICAILGDAVHDIVEFGEGRLPGIEYIARGYDALTGNVFATSTAGDSGIRKNIFDLTAVSQGAIYDGFKVPDDVSILGEGACGEQYVYDEITGSHSYSNSLKQAAEIKEDALFVAFSASEEYEHVYSESSSNGNIFISSYAKCAVYRASLSGTTTLPAFSENFENLVATLPLEWDMADKSIKETFMEFIAEFGTHYVDDITMGGRFGSISTMSSSSYSRLSPSELTDFNLEAAAKYTTISKSAAKATLSEDEKKMVAVFEQETGKRTKIFMVGGDLARNNSVSTWRETLKSDPMPIHYTFNIISDLLKPHNFADDADITKKQFALKAALSAYCSILGEIECNGYPPDPELPPLHVLKGYYSQYQQVQSPYTKDFNCPTGYIPITYYYGYLSDLALKYYQSFYCLNQVEFEQYGNTDPLHEFGGFYQQCRRSLSEPKKYDVCMNGNHLMDNDKCECPPDYEAISIAPSALTEPRGENWGNLPEECRDDEISRSYTNTFLCYNPKITDPKMFGATYTNRTDSAQEPINNPFTKTTSCPRGFKAYRMLEYQDRNKDKSTVYACLPTAYYSE